MRRLRVGLSAALWDSKGQRCVRVRVCECVCAYLRD